MKKQDPKKRILRGRSAGIMIEDLDSKLDMILEKVESSEMRVMTTMEEMKTEIKEDIQGIHTVFRYQGEKIRKLEEEVSLIKGTLSH